MPNAFGEYDEQPNETGELLCDFAASQFANIVGGCCGTTPDHIKAVAKGPGNPTFDGYVTASGTTLDATLNTATTLLPLIDNDDYQITWTITHSGRTKIYGRWFGPN